jgi:hypothetical protein
LVRLSHKRYLWLAPHLAASTALSCPSDGYAKRCSEHAFVLQMLILKMYHRVVRLCIRRLCVLLSVKATGGLVQVVGADVQSHRYHIHTTALRGSFYRNPIIAQSSPLHLWALLIFLNAMTSLSLFISMLPLSCLHSLTPLRAGKQRN